MSVPKTTTLGLVGLLVCGVAALPAIAAPKPAPKPKPITGTYQASATPDPTPIAGDVCTPTLPGAMHTKEFTVPAKGVLYIDLQNTLDWAVKVRATNGDVLGSQDGGTPEMKESTSIVFKKKEKVFIDTCNFAGEPTITVNYRFVYK